MTLCDSAVANEPAAIKLHTGESGSAAERQRSRSTNLRDTSMCVSAVANEPAVIKLHEGEYSRAAEQERSRATTKRLSRAKQCDDSVRQRSCQ